MNGPKSQDPLTINRICTMVVVLTFLFGPFYTDTALIT